MSRIDVPGFEQDKLVECVVKRLAYWYRHVDEAGRVALTVLGLAANKLSSNVALA
jgi:hypothetical protein